MVIRFGVRGVPTTNSSIQLCLSRRSLFQSTCVVSLVVYAPIHSLKLYRKPMFSVIERLLCEKNHLQVGTSGKERGSYRCQCTVLQLARGPRSVLSGARALHRNYRCVFQIMCLRPMGVSFFMRKGGQQDAACSSPWPLRRSGADVP